MCSENLILRWKWQRRGDIIASAPRMLQFSSEMQLTWHIYWSRAKNSETGTLLILVSSALLGSLKKAFFMSFLSWQSPNQSIFLRGDFSKDNSRIKQQLLL
jgi:hypothetical protein